jgi:glutamyl-tRNA reductase
LPDLKEFPSTAHPNLSDLEEIFARLVPRVSGLVYLTTSSRLSATVNLAYQAKKKFPDTRIEIYEGGVGIGRLALLALEALEAGEAKEGVRGLDGAGLQTPSLAQTPPVVAAQAIGLEDIPKAIPQADLVISSVGAPEPVLTHAALADVLRRRDAALLVIDIAVPRNVDERLGRLDNIYLYNIDDLDRLVARNLERRRQEIPKAEAIVESEVAEFGRWLASLEVAPTIRLLQERLAALQKAQIERYGRKFADRSELETFTQSLVNQILHSPVSYLKGLSTDGSTSDRLAAVDMIRRMFNLDEK